MLGVSGAGYQEQLREASQDQTSHVQEGAAARGGWAGGMGSGGTAVSHWDRFQTQPRESGPPPSQHSGELRLSRKVSSVAGGQRSGMHKGLLDSCLC